MSDQENTNPEEQDNSLHDSIPVTGMYKDWFLDYASYVILERAVPAIEDGLKPVQRRILHAMKEMDDGRFNKVANIIGQSMQYHPHGDASIGDAIVNLGQKELLIETQGNWGDIRTGDSAAAARYIEARLSKFALEVVFNPQTTDWQLSYDGRKREPVTLPVKFPLLLAQGVEGIAVGLSTKILPHNFIELIQGSIAILKGEKTNVLPDFPTGGLADFSEYNEGLRGGRIKVRARIEEEDSKTLLIKDIPYGTTTNSLIDSIIKANDKGKIKIKKVVDNTAKDVEIQIQLAPGQSPDMTIDALYAFTDCEVSISPNACVIIEEKPVFLTVNDILAYNTKQTRALLKKELEIRKAELMEKLLFSSLEKIFIENRIYRDIEECTTWESVIETIDKGLEPFKPDFYREITTEDIVRLTEIRIKRISKFDTFKADELMRKLQEELKEVNYNLKHLTEYAIKYYENLLTKYGKGRERKTEIRAFDTIEATVVAANNAKLYVNRADGFVGYGLKKDEFVCDCSDLDDVIVIRRDGKCVVTRIQEKGFVGKDILHVAIFRKGDERMVYNLIYLDGGSGRAMVKRFQVLAVTRDREYELTKGSKGSKVLYLTANPNGEAEIVTVYLTQGAKARIKVFDFDFSTIEIKGRGAGGNILTRYPIRKIQLKMEGVSTLGGLDIYYDSVVGRLNTDERGRLIGNFLGDDKIIVFYKNGDYELTSFELTNRYEAGNVMLIEKFDPQKIISIIYYDGTGKTHYVKRFLIETTTMNKKFNVISDHKSSQLKIVSTDKQPQVKALLRKGKVEEEQEYDLDMLIDVKGWKAIGNKLSSHDVVSLSLINSEPKEDSSPNESKTKNTSEDSDTDEDLEVGSTVEFKVKKEEDDKDQLGLF
ncbi:Topoisomerase IV subunit A [Indibacter alkaliphilus LW1]|uniref:Topoisomerase IV subunit A n=1 Tax=Indibacter alkaliphilus (strain CCUG 57479 / KCTC 22604 / LW1) TaxID=1189612 RepID=S2E2A9_INDAL|nr:DNA gyrase/topoisomerase IV subunit A [Indibacter alkaliphilus]EOZ98596.1 Topoisomerase IV subunit A [Indibacter alkaliphilus LW1]